MNIIHELAQSYASHFSTPEDSLLRQIALETNQSHPQAHMLSGHVQGKFLEFISILLKPRYILEIGTFTGYSALCLAKGLQEGGELHTLELRAEEAAIAKGNFSKTSAVSRIILHQGNALEILSGLNKPWDLVFIDADKTNYIQYYQQVLPQMRSGGLIIADNVLFHGQVLENPVTGKNALAIQAFNEFVQQDDRVENVLLTIRDGLMLIIKK